MPQTVPSAGYTPPYCDYSAFTTDFDLSLLPASPESEVPLSPSHLSPFLSLYPSSPPMFSASLEDGILCDNLGFVNLKTKLNDDIKNEFEDEPLHTPLKKSLSSGFFDDKMDTKDKNEKYDYFVKKEDDKYSQPLIPTTVQASTSYYPLTIKQEPNFGLNDYGQVPDYQKNPPSPYGIKTEKTIDLQEVLKESQYLQNLVKYENQTKQYTTLQSLLKNTNTKTENLDSKTDHQLLRSVLRDTSFQKKFNIKPFEIPRTTATPPPNAGFQEGEKSIKMEGESSDNKGAEGNEIVEELTSEKIEPVFSLAIEQIKRDVDNTCNILGIASGK